MAGSASSDSGQIVGTTWPAITAMLAHAGAALLLFADFDVATAERVAASLEDRPP